MKLCSPIPHPSCAKLFQKAVSLHVASSILGQSYNMVTEFRVAWDTIYIVILDFVILVMN